MRLTLNEYERERGKDINYYIIDIPYLYEKDNATLYASGSQNIIQGQPFVSFLTFAISNCVMSILHLPCMESVPRGFLLMSNGDWSVRELRSRYRTSL